MSDNIEILSSRHIYSCRVFDVVEEQVRLRHGVTTVMATVQHKGAVVILPITDEGELLFIRQYRHALKRELLELPAGGLSIGENPIDCARRELSEETGFSAHELISLGQIHPAPGFCSEVLHAFVARRLFEHSLPGDVDEDVTVVKMSEGKLIELIQSNEITDSKTIAVYYKAKIAGLLR